MELIGLEIENYAGLEKQYVPYTDRVHLLVGKNNAGKTALLHVIAARRLLQFRNYCELQTVEFSYYLRQRESDTPVTPVLTDYYGALMQLDCTFKCTWSAPPQNGGRPGIVRASVIFPDGIVLPLIFHEGNRLIMQYYKRRGAAWLREKSTPHFDGEVNNLWSYVAAHDAFSYIDPHRKVEHAVSAAEYSELPTNGSNLAAFLLTMRGNDRRRFEAIEQTFLDCFPEYVSLDLPLKSNQVGVELEEGRTERKIPIAQCGTGVEQMLILISVIMGSKTERIFLIDEPQDFLHPFLERRLINIIDQSKHKFFIATHSATLINSVQPEQITFVERPGQSFEEFSERKMKTGQVLTRLGYRNSDFLFYDGALFVEGSSDKELLPLLFKKAAQFEWQKMRDVCLCDLGGSREYFKFDDLAEDLIAQEKLIDALHRRGLPHLYLFDGDKQREANRAGAMQPAGVPLSFDFLARNELENYLLDPDAIAAAINTERVDRNIEEKVTPEKVRLKLDELINVKKSVDRKLYDHLYKIEPQPSDKRIRIVQGSRALAKLYEHFQLQYHKTRTGAMIIDHLQLTPESSTELSATLTRIIEVLRPRAAEQ